MRKLPPLGSLRAFEAAALLGNDAPNLTPAINNAQEGYLVIEQRLKAMDAQAIDMEVLSINPFWYSKDRDLAEKIVTVQNEKLAELVASKGASVVLVARRADALRAVAAKCGPRAWAISSRSGTSGMKLSTCNEMTSAKAVAN